MNKKKATAITPTGPSRIYPFTSTDPDSGRQVRVKDADGALIYFPFPVSANAEGLPVKKDGTVAVITERIVPKLTPLKDNLLSAQTGEKVYFNSDTMTADQRRALTRSNQLPVAATRLSKLLDEIETNVKFSGWKHTPEDFRKEAWTRIAGLVNGLQGSMFPRVPESTDKAKVGKVNHFSQWLAAK